MNPQELIAQAIEQIRGMWRYRWWAAGLAWLISIGGWLYIFAMPDVYQASAKVFVDTNSLLRPLMQGLTAEQDPLDAVQLVSRSALTRPNLEAVARQTDLLLRANTLAEEQELITELQARIQVTGGRDNIFTVQYADRNRDKAVEVVAAVLDTFVENALGTQGTDADLTERALAGEIQAHVERLRAAEAALAEFKKENLGYMPGEAGDYYERLQAALADVSETEDRISLLTERRDELRRQIGGEEPVFGIMPGGATETGGACAQAGQISNLRAQLSELLVTYTPRHPRVETLQQTISSLESRCSEERSAALTSSSASPRPSTPLDLNPVYQNLRIQLSDAEVELVELRARLRTYQDAVAQLRRDVDKIADVETELKQLNRDYDVVQNRHQELLRRWEDLQAKRRLDPVTENVRFQRIEPPFALPDPVGPNRPMLLAGVFVVALAIGVAAAFGLNHVSPVFFSRAGLHRAVDLPVLGSVSLLLAEEESSRRRRAAAAWVGAYIVLAVATFAIVVLSRPVSAVFRDLLQGVIA